MLRMSICPEVYVVVPEICPGEEILHILQFFFVSVDLILEIEDVPV